MKRLRVTNCKDCPHFRTDRFYTADSWEYILNWICKKTTRPTPSFRDYDPVVKDSSLIAQVEHARDEPKKVPDWCPIAPSALEQLAEEAE